MPQGHDIFIQGERFDFYLHDPQATSDNDLLTPSDDSLFHVRSRISGQILPFIGLEHFKEDASYMEDVKAAIARVVEHGGQDQDIISLLPNREIVSDNRMLSFNHLLDDAMIKGRPASSMAGDKDIVLRETPISDYINRYHYSSTLFTPISRLHSDTNTTTLPFEDYRALMDEVRRLAEAPDTDLKLASNLRLLQTTWEARVVEQDGNAEFLRKPGDALIQRVSDQLKTGFFKSVRDIASDIIDLHQHDEEVLRFGALANRIAHISSSEHVMDRIIRHLSVNIPESDEPDTHHPAAVAAARMLVSDNPHLTIDELVKSKLFDPAHGRTTVVRNETSRTSPHTEGIRQLSLSSSQEGARNIFQFAERCDWSPMLFSRWGTETSSLFKNANQNRFWDDIQAGKPLRKLLRGTIHSNEQFGPDDPAKRPLSKRATHLYLHNAMAIDRINAAMTTQSGCGPESLYTDSGERFVISFDKQSGHYVSYPSETRITYLNTQGDVIFDHQGDPNRRASTRGMTPLHFKNIFKDPLHFLQLPPGKLSSYEEFNAVVGSLANNKTLSLMTSKGYLDHLDQTRDDQGRKVSRKDYQSWIDVVAAKAGNPDDVSQYLSNDYLRDSDTIADDIMRSLFLNMAKGSGLLVGSCYTGDDLAKDDDINKDEAFTLNGEDISIQTGRLDLDDIKRGYINYKKDMVERADQLHHVGATLVKSHMPQADLQWEPATEKISLGTLDDGTELHAEPLHSYGEIQRHGQSMNHCAGTYSSQCMAGSYYLWAIMGTSPDGQRKELSTLGMNYHNGELEFDQHFGYDNASVPEPINGRVQQLAEDLSHTANEQNYDVYDNWDEDDPEFDEESRSHEPTYDVGFSPLSYEGGNDLSPEDVAEVIANYHWQSEEFGQDAMRLLSRVYGDDKVKDAMIHTIDINLDDKGDTWPDDLVTRMKEFREYVQDYSLDENQDMRQAM